MSRNTIRCMWIIYCDSQAVIAIRKLSGRGRGRPIESNRIRHAAAGEDVDVGGRPLLWRFAGVREDAHERLPFLDPR